MYYKFFDMLHYNIQYMIYRVRETPIQSLTRKLFVKWKNSKFQTKVVS